MQVNESRSNIDLFLLSFQVNKDLGCTYVLSNCTYYNHNISNFLCKNYFEHHIHSLASKLFITYFYYRKVIEILYSTYHKPNRSHDGFILLLTRPFFNTFFMHIQKIASIINFVQTIFSIYFTMLLPLDLILILNYMKIYSKYSISIHAKYFLKCDPRY